MQQCRCGRPMGIFDRECGACLRRDLIWAGINTVLVLAGGAAIFFVCRSL